MLEVQPMSVLQENALDLKFISGALQMSRDGCNQLSSLITAFV